MTIDEQELLVCHVVDTGIDPHHCLVAVDFEDMFRRGVPETDGVERIRANVDDGSAIQQDPAARAEVSMLYDDFVLSSVDVELPTLTAHHTARRRPDANT